MKSEATPSLRDYIIKTRQERKLSQNDVARRGSIPRGTLSAIEAGRNTTPKQETLLGLAKGLDVQYDVLDRLVRGLPPYPASPQGKTDEILNLIDDLPLNEGHRRMLKNAIRQMIEDLKAEEFDNA